MQNILIFEKKRINVEDFGKESEPDTTLIKRESGKKEYFYRGRLVLIQEEM